MKETIQICPKCRGTVPPDAPGGLCPKCVLEGVSGPVLTEPAQGGSSEVPSLDEIRAAFPQFEILELIGAGGMGAVYKARQPKLDRFVALKILPHSLAATPGFADSFCREARVLARLNHPNIVTVHDFGEANGFFYLLMEFVDGANLRQAMEAGRFSPEHALALVPKICEALQFAHDQGILHRDIKPENILLDAHGRVKIADFGIAKLIGEKAGDKTLTASGAVVGTPRYMAPEQMERPREVDNRADIYSLGVVFYEMLTGELPVGKFAPPSEKASVDPRVDPIVLRSLERERERRYRTVNEVRTSVERIRAEAPQEAQQARAEESDLPPLQPRRAQQDFLICNPRLPRMAQAITAFGLVVSPLFWLAGLGMPAATVPKDLYASILHTVSNATVQSGDFVAVVLMFVGGWKLRNLNWAAPQILRITIWFHLVLGVVGLGGVIAAEFFASETVEEPFTPLDSVYAALGLGVIAFEIAALVWLRRNRSVLGEVCGPAGAAGTQSALLRPYRQLRAARGALASLVFTLLSVPMGLVFLTTFWFAIYTRPGMDWMRENGVDLASGVGLAVVPGSLGFLLGVWALQQVRAAGGRLRGRFRALIGALAWPALIVVAAVSFLCGRLFGGFSAQDPGYAAKLVACAAPALGAGVALVFLTYRWSRGGAPAGIARNLGVAGLAAVLLLWPAWVSASIGGVLGLQRLTPMVENGVGSRAAEPSPAGTGTAEPADAAPANTTAND